MTTEYTILPEWEAHERFDEDLNDCYGEVKVCGYTYEAARLLKKVDPIAYHQEFLGWMDAYNIQVEE